MLFEAFILAFYSDCIVSNNTLRATDVSNLDLDYVGIYGVIFVYYVISLQLFLLGISDE